VIERQGVLTGHISAALRRLLGMRTLAGAAVGSGMMAEVVGAAAASSARFIFCVVGPHAVDLAALWHSPDGATLCSCWGHTENVALLSMAGESSTCWHANAFMAAVEGLPDHKDEIFQLLRVTDNTKPYAVDICTWRGLAAAAFDGVIYSPVVATRRRDIKCVAVGCRSSQRRCHHAVLVRELDRLVVKDGAEDGMTDGSSEDDGPIYKENDEDRDVDEDELIAIAKDRQKRNLVSCPNEDRQSLLWARAAEWGAEYVPAPDLFSRPLSTENEATPPSESPTLLQKMAALGLAFDPSVVLFENSCSTCGATKPDSTRIEGRAALLHCDGNSAEPLDVRSPFISCIAVFLECPCRSRSALKQTLAVSFFFIS